MSSESSEQAIRALRQALPENAIFTEREVLYRASMDNMRYSRMPSLVIFPTNEEDIAAVLSIANAHRIPLTARGAGSATTGATTPSEDGWVIDLSEWNQLEIDATAMMAYVQPGVTVEALDLAARKEGLFYPPDPGSKKFATIGGNLACNAGGLRGAKYGVTRDYVYELSGFLPTGEFVRWGADVKKFVSGYNIRDLWVGSEGTLGIITGAVMKLLPLPAATRTLIARFTDESTALDGAHSILGQRIIPSVLEFMDRETVACVRQQDLRLGQKTPFAEKGDPLLLIELDGHPAQVEDDFERVSQTLTEFAEESESAANSEEAEKIWTVRRSCSRAMFALGDTKINEDVVVPMRAQHDLIDFVYQIREEIQLPTPIFGHVADGNFHVHIMYNQGDPTHRDRARDGVIKIMEEVVNLGGSISGEHGIGLAKTPFLPLQLDSAELELMQRVKNVFDPNNILNPGKLFNRFDVWEHQRENVKMPWDH